MILLHLPFTIFAPVRTSKCVAMKMTKKIWATIAVAWVALISPMAQETIDLNVQRRESQQIRLIPGEKIEHGGIVINPTPQQLVCNSDESLDVSVGFAIKDKQKCFADNLAFLLPSKRGVELRIDFGDKVADKMQVEAKPGAYRLTVDDKGVSIVGRDERGAFYGIQTLRQLLESPASANGKLPHVEVNDYPDILNRGVVEGFYGNPWAHQVRLSLIDFYGKFKLNTYIFGPKDDPYHSSPHWRKPYPADEAEEIKELVTACRKNRVDFVWAIHPGKDIRWDEEDFNNLVNKFDAMYQLGVRSFAIFFDDISGEGTNPEKQTALLNRLVTDFIEPRGDVTPLIFCPTDYTKAWANPTPQGSLPLFGQKLHPSIRVFWTGDAVCSDVTKSTLDWVNSRILRPAFSWWNYPVTDYVRHLLLQGPVYGLDTTLKQGTDISGLVSNPMEHGEASKLALYSVADYAWNVADYNPLDSWERALVELAGQAAPAYRTFAIHSGDTGTGYRRDESWETETFSIDRYTPEQYAALLSEFKKIERVADEMEAYCPNKPLLNELTPWLREFARLGTRGRKALELMKLYEAGQSDRFWEAYVNNLMSPEERKAFDAHSSGTMKLQPFYENSMDAMLAGFFKQLTGGIPAIHKAVGSYSNLRTPSYKLMFDNDTATYYTSGRSQATNHWVGVDLGRVQDIYDIEIVQGRNSVDDVDYFDHAILEYSVDGNEWHALTDSLRNTYTIRWQGDDIKGRYVRLRKLPSAKRNWIAIRTFAVNPPRLDKLGFCIEDSDVQAALQAFDKHPGTSYRNKNVLSFQLPEGCKNITLLMAPSDTPLMVRQWASDGSLLSEVALTTSFASLTVQTQVAKIELQGNRELYEVIF